MVSPSIWSGAGRSNSTVMTRHGEQEGVARGYNPAKPGRVSHHPLMAFVSETRMVANCWCAWAWC